MVPLFEAQFKTFFLNTRWGKKSLSTESNDLRRETPLLGMSWWRRTEVMELYQTYLRPCQGPGAPRHLGNLSNWSQWWLVLEAYDLRTINPHPSWSSMLEQWRRRKMAYCATSECWQVDNSITLAVETVIKQERTWVCTKTHMTPRL